MKLNKMIARVIYDFYTKIFSRLNVITVTVTQSAAMDADFESYVASRMRPIDQGLVEANNNNNNNADKEHINPEDVPLNETANNNNNNNTADASSNSNEDVAIDIDLNYTETASASDAIDLNLKNLENLKAAVASASKQLEVTIQECTEIATKNAEVKALAATNNNTSTYVLTNTASIKQTLLEIKASFTQLLLKLTEVITNWGSHNKVLTGLLIGIGVVGGVYVSYRIFFGGPRGSSVYIVNQLPVAPSGIPTGVMPNGGDIIRAPQQITDVIRRHTLNLNVNPRDVGLGVIISGILMRLLKSL